jgi:hypothetical protein
MLSQTLPRKIAAKQKFLASISDRIQNKLMSRILDLWEMAVLRSG